MSSLSLQLINPGTEGGNTSIKDFMLISPQMFPVFPAQHLEKIHTRGDKDAALASLEFMEGSQPVRLTHLAMDWDCVKAQISEHKCKFPGVVASPREKHERGAGELCQIIHQVAVLQVDEFREFKGKC